MAHIKLELFHEGSNTTISRDITLADANLMRLIAYYRSKFSTFVGPPPAEVEPHWEPATQNEAITKLFQETIGQWREETITWERNAEIANISVPEIT